MNMLQAHALARAAGEVGVREAGRNRGPRVEMYQRAAKGAPGEPYCVDFILWCYLEGVHALNVRMPLPLYRGALELWRHVDPWMHWHAPSPGSIFIHDHGNEKGHAGFVEDVRGDGTMLTIEANTGPSPDIRLNDRDGDGVYRRHDRTIDDTRLVGFIDVSRRAP